MMEAATLIAGDALTGNATIDVSDPSCREAFTDANALPSDRLGDGYVPELTSIEGIDSTNPLKQDEVFGPVRAILTFRTPDKAIALANCTDYGVVAGVWTTELTAAHWMMQDVVTGQASANTYEASSGVEMPFGGFRRSGHGRETGVEGLSDLGWIKRAVVAP